MKVYAYVQCNLILTSLSLPKKTWLKGHFCNVGHLHMCRSKKMWSRSQLLQKPGKTNDGDWVLATTDASVGFPIGIFWLSSVTLFQCCEVAIFSKGTLQMSRLKHCSSQYYLCFHPHPLPAGNMGDWRVKLSISLPCGEKKTPVIYVQKTRNI